MIHGTVLDKQYSLGMTCGRRTVSHHKDCLPRLIDLLKHMQQFMGGPGIPKAPVGSSARMSLGSVISALAIAVRVLTPGNFVRKFVQQIGDPKHLDKR